MKIFLFLISFSCFAAQEMTLQEAKDYLESLKGRSNLTSVDVEKAKEALKIVSSSWAKRD